MDEWDKLSEDRKESLLDIVRSMDFGPTYIGHDDIVDIESFMGSRIWKWPESSLDRSCWKAMTPSKFEELYLGRWCDDKYTLVNQAAPSWGLGQVEVNVDLRYFVSPFWRIGIYAGLDHELIIATPLSSSELKVNITNSNSCLDYFKNHKFTEISCLNERIINLLPKASVVSTNGIPPQRWQNIVRKVLEKSQKIPEAENIAPIKPTHLPDVLKDCTMISPTEVQYGGKTFVKDSVNVWRESITLIEAESYILARRTLG